VRLGRVEMDDSNRGDKFRRPKSVVSETLKSANTNGYCSVRVDAESVGEKAEDVCRNSSAIGW
jgi:hypothetical protein